MFRLHCMILPKVLIFHHLIFHVKIFTHPQLGSDWCPSCDFSHEDFCPPLTRPQPAPIVWFFPPILRFFSWRFSPTSDQALVASLCVHCVRCSKERPLKKIQTPITTILRAFRLHSLTVLNGVSNVERNNYGLTTHDILPPTKCSNFIAIFLLC